MEETRIGQYMIYDKSSRMINTLLVRLDGGGAWVDPRDSETLDRGLMGSRIAWMDVNTVEGNFSDRLGDYGWTVNEDGSTILKQQ